MRSKAAILRRCTAFTDAAPETFRTLALSGELRTVSRRAPLLIPGRNNPLVMRSGVVRESSGAGERAITFGFHGRGHLIGSDLLFSPAEVHVEAYEDCVVLEVVMVDLRRCLERDVGLNQGFAKWENTRARQVREQLTVVAASSASRRLADALIKLAKRFGVRDSRGTIVNLRLTHRELSGLIGSTRETVSVTVTEFRKAGLIEVDGKRFVLLDKRALAALAEGEGG